MGSESVLSGFNNKLNPLISFYSIVDTDIGLMNLIHNEYLDKTVFNWDFFYDDDFYKKISSIYYRSDKNLLRVFANDKSNPRLDEYYKDFIETCQSKILDYSITTEILTLIDTFNMTQEIRPTLLCYTKEQIEVLEDEPLLSKNNKVLLSSMTEEEKLSFSQYFFCDIEEIYNFSECRLKTIYISSKGTNLTEDGADIKDDPIISTLIQHANHISIFDMYSRDIIKKGN